MPNQPHTDGWLSRITGRLPEWVPMVLWKLRRDKADQMAAALTYRTIFSMIPMLALALLVFHAAGGFNKLSASLETKIYDYFGLATLYLDVPATQATTEPADSTVDAATAPVDTAVQRHEAAIIKRAKDAQEMRELMKKALADVNTTVQSLSFRRIGAVGMVLFIWAAIALVVGIESSFNTIYNAPRGRPWHMRVTIYWAAITLGPLLLFVSSYLADRVASMALGITKPAATQPARTPATPEANQAASQPTIAPADSSKSDTPNTPLESGFLASLLAVGMRLLALLASWLLLFLLYRLMPNTRVNTRPALIGSFIAALAWEIGKGALRLYVGKFVTHSVVYGSLTLVPLFLLWIYITWLIVLFGLELCYVLQMLHNSRFRYLVDYTDRDLFYDPRWLIPMMGLIGGEFGRGSTVSGDRLARELSLPVRVVTYLGNRLESAGLIRRTRVRGENDDDYTLAMPPDRIKVADLIALSRTIANEASVEEKSGVARRSLPGGDFLRQLDEAQSTAATAHTTLAQLLREPK